MVTGWNGAQMDLQTQPKNTYKNDHFPTQHKSQFPLYLTTCHIITEECYQK